MQSNIVSIPGTDKTYLPDFTIGLVFIIIVSMVYSPTKRSNSSFPLASLGRASANGKPEFKRFVGL